MGDFQLKFQGEIPRGTKWEILKNEFRGSFSAKLSGGDSKENRWENFEGRISGEFQD